MGHLTAGNAAPSNNTIATNKTSLGVRGFLLCIVGFVIVAGGAGLYMFAYNLGHGSDPPSQEFLRPVAMIGLGTIAVGAVLVAVGVLKLIF